MSNPPEAVRLNLEFHRKQAKALLKAARSGDAAAVARLAAVLPRGARAGVRGPALHDAQLAIAREQGFASWTRLKAFALAQGARDPQLAAQFVDRALADAAAADRLLRDHPDVSRTTVHAALVSGEIAVVRAALAADPDLPRTAGGPRGWVPLLYTCLSRLARPGSDRSSSMVDTARLLLEYGADPNAAFVLTDYPDNPTLSSLYGAAGLNGNPDLAAVLLDAGANPNDGESLYHSTEHADLACLRLLLARGARVPGSNALKHALDWETVEGVRLLLAAGAEPNELNHRGETALHWAVWRGRSATVVSLLIDAGADLDRRRWDGRTAYAIAVHGGRRDLAELLASRGATTELVPIDRLMEAVHQGDAAAIERLLADRTALDGAADERLLPDLASRHCTEAVRALLRVGVPVDARGEHGGTALHWACWKGYADLVAMLIAHGASLTIEDRQFHAPPPGWFDHGVRNCGERHGADYPAVARLLAAAGALLPAQSPTGEAAVDAILVEHGLLAAGASS